MDNLAPTNGLYIFGVVPNYYEAGHFRKLGDVGVYSVPFQKISAIVSKSEVTDYKQLGTELLAKLLVDHQTTLESIMNLGFTTIIPMRIGTFAENTDELLRILEKGYDLIFDTIQKVANMVEYDIVATWSDFGRVISEVASSPRVMEMKVKIEANGGAITQADQMSIGFLVKNLIDERNSKYATKISEAFSLFCQNIKQHQLLNDQMVTNTALLVGQSQTALLGSAIDQLDQSLNGELDFKMVGPLPCYSFYTLEVKELYFDDIDSARKELGLDDVTSEKLIKQAYLEKARLFHPDTNTIDEDPLKFNRINQAYQILSDYVQSVKPASRDDLFLLSIDAVTNNSFFLKFKE